MGRITRERTMCVRGIKFRGMDLQGRWFYGNYAVLHKDLRSTGNKAGHYISNSAGAPFAYAVRPETVGQYTGLKDKNGKEVYEGDIFEAPHDFGPGGFEARRSVVRFHPERGYQWEYWLLDQLEVLGNVHEHPHLLGASASDSTE
jgi:hypothetical protein